MARDLNQCNFIGRLGKDPDCRYLPNGDAVTNFSIACSDDYTKDGQKHEKTEWINCVAYRKLGEIVGEYCKKGSQVFVSGKFTTQKYEKDGSTRYSTVIVVDKLQMLGGKASNNSSGDSDYHEPQESAPQAAKQAPSMDDFPDDPPF